MKPPMDRGSDRCYVPEVLPESTANIRISVHNVGCLKRMLKGETETVHEYGRVHGEDFPRVQGWT